jgi:hypothetical protein
MQHCLVRNEMKLPQVAARLIKARRASCVLEPTSAVGQGPTPGGPDLGRFSPETGHAAHRPQGATAAPANIRNWHKTDIPAYARLTW